MFKAKCCICRKNENFDTEYDCYAEGDWASEFFVIVEDRYIPISGPVCPVCSRTHLTLDEFGYRLNMHAGLQISTTPE